MKELNMDWGMKNRYNSVFNEKSGRTIFFAVDHGYFMGPTTGLEDMYKAIHPAIDYADALMLTRGALRSAVDPKLKKPISLRVSSGTSILNEDLLHEGISVDIEEAVRLNAAFVAFSVMVGTPESERDTILEFSKMVDAAERYGIPTLGVVAVGRGLNRDARYLSLATRMVGELGARLVKTYYCENFERVIETSLVPVVIAGGKKIPEKDALQMARDALDAGAIGVDMGRNVFQADDPVAMMRALAKLVHEDGSVEDAYAYYQELKGK
ncbi:3-hydroxy-5-phosphonooxypentane-2,4-dione thiolase [Oceanithermus sp.]